MLPEVPVEPYFLLAIAALFAGLLDAVVGGGGLILVPALFGVYPNAPPAMLFGTNKLASIFGTAFAAKTYLTKVAIDYTLVLPATIAALIFGFIGAWAMSTVPPELFRKLLPFILALVALHVFWHRDFGTQVTTGVQGRSRLVAAALLGAAIGFYDGFFGPGTGSFLVFLLVRFFGHDFLEASATAKIINVACNFTALAWFIPTTQPLWAVALLMAAFNILGSWIGARLAIQEGARFVRKIFLVVVFALIVKTAWDAFGN